MRQRGYRAVRKSGLSLWLGSLILLFAVPAARAQGIIVPSAGPINSAMAGASTAAPVDFGASYWNPAILSGLEEPEFLLGSALAFPSIHLQSGIPADSIGGVLPITGRYGEARSNSGVAPGLATGFSFRMTDDSPVTFGLGVFGLVGGSVNFPGSAQTPVLGPRQPPKYFGVGPIYSNVSLLSIAPMVSLQLTDRLAMGGGPIITSGTPSFNPAFFAPGPKDSNGLPTFPSATNSRADWGAGFQLGLFYELSQDWNLGFSYKSPVWQEKWNFNTSTPNLAGRTIGIQAGLPEILSWGVAYKGLPKTLIDVDLRYIDYANTPLFGTKVVDGGLGWQSVFAVAMGVQYKATEKLSLLGGYLYNTNPVRNETTLFNVQAPGIITNTLSLGSSYNVTEDITASIAWVHGFRNSIAGSILQVPGTQVRLDAQVDTLWMGVNVRFGRKKQTGPANSPGTLVFERPTTLPTSNDIPIPTAPGPTAPEIGDSSLSSIPADEPAQTVREIADPPADRPQ
jgi:long-chain fatty acid transport protein